ncbi:HIT domain-containing protein [Alcanivorax sp.]|jgi:diadenosine tetraphosphate (Ap4A) HIT family hydrolase|uniref:HIT family protein n=1 Tax=Alcanivorax sp. TaxID=1872427 RepID=UPI0025BCD9BB|nr:HIT domain-containing protein [Alcanivorax sp.]
MSDCPFCAEPAALAEGIELHNALAYVREDKYPVSPGHLFIIPRRHAEDWLSLTLEELGAIILHIIRFWLTAAIAVNSIVKVIMLKRKRTD